MNEQARKNMELVQKLMSENAAKQEQVVRQGNKAPIPVEVDYEADSGERYVGTVYFRRPSSMDYIRMGAVKSEILRSFGVRPIIEYVPLPTGGMERVESMAHIDNSIKYLAQAIAACDVLLTGQIPVWFQNHRDLEDSDLVIYVYRRFDEELLSFRTGANGSPATNSQAGDNQAPLANPQDLREREPQGDRGNTAAE